MKKPIFQAVSEPVVFLANSGSRVYTERYSIRSAYFGLARACASREPPLTASLWEPALVWDGLWEGAEYIQREGDDLQTRSCSP